MVSVKNATWRYATDKELFGKTTSAKGKEIAKFLQYYKKMNDKLMFHVTQNDLVYIMNEYTKVESPGTDGWYTLTIWDNHMYKEIANSKPMNVFSINPSTKEYAFGARKDIPAKTADELLWWAWFSISMKRQVDKYSRQHNFIDTWGVVHEYLKRVLKQVKFSKVKKVGEKWAEMEIIDYGTFSNRGRKVNKFYVEFETLNMVNVNEVDSTAVIGTAASKIEQEIENIKKSRIPNTSISVELDEYIKSNFTKGGSPEVGKWYKVYKSGNDSKYGSYMVNFDMKLWRGKSFDEFYGGGIVD